MTKPNRTSNRWRAKSVAFVSSVGFRASRELESVFEQITQTWGRLDILVHSAAFAPKEDLQGGLLNCSAEGFAKAMDISCHSFIRMAKLAAPLMKDGGTMFTMTYHGANKVISNYNVMGPVKAALEAPAAIWPRTRPEEIRVHAISPGPLKTRASSGLKDFDCFSPMRRNARRLENWSTSWTSASLARFSRLPTLAGYG